jgi:hypothetical protein
MPRLDGKVFITGAARGRSHAIGLAQEGADNLTGAWHAGAGDEPVEISNAVLFLASGEAATSLAPRFPSTPAHSSMDA